MQEIQITFGESVEYQALQDVIKAASKRFGGATVRKGKGSWKSPDRGIVTEKSRTLYVRVPDSYDREISVESWAKNHAQLLKDYSNEDSIMWDIREIKSGGFV